MKKIITALSLITLSTTPAASDIVSINMFCDSPQNIANLISSYNDVPIGGGKTRVIINQVQHPGTMIFWGDPDDKSWTITFTPAGNENSTLCVLQAGSEFEPAEDWENSEEYES